MNPQPGHRRALDRGSEAAELGHRGGRALLEWMCGRREVTFLGGEGPRRRGARPRRDEGDGGGPPELRSGRPGERPVLRAAGRAPRVRPSRPSARRHRRSHRRRQRPRARRGAHRAPRNRPPPARLHPARRRPPWPVARCRPWQIPRRRGGPAGRGRRGVAGSDRLGHPRPPGSIPARLRGDGAHGHRDRQPLPCRRARRHQARRVPTACPERNLRARREEVASLSRAGRLSIRGDERLDGRRRTPLVEALRWGHHRPASVTPPLEARGRRAAEVDNCSLHAR